MVEMLFTNKRTFKKVFCSPRNDTQFELALCFNKQGKLDTDPSMEEHVNSFRVIFKQMEDSIFKNSFISFFLQDLPELFYTEPAIAVRHPILLHMQKVVSEMEMQMNENVDYN